MMQGDYKHRDQSTSGRAETQQEIHKFGEFDDVLRTQKRIFHNHT